MDIMIFIGLLLVGGLLNFIWEPTAKTVHCLAKCYLLLTIYLTFAAGVFYLASVRNAFIHQALALLLQYGDYLSHLAAGFLTGNILLGLSKEDELFTWPQLQDITTIVLWAAAVSIGLSFIIESCWKTEHFSKMLSFFTASGYRVWFLYFIIVVETLSGFGLLLHFKLKTGPWAAIGLVLIMLGAICTHWHNHDPFSQSYGAAGQLINLAIILILYYLERQVATKPTETQIYVI
ncbi:MAG: DoxX family protein [Sphingobacteriales bacterium]